MEKQNQGLRKFVIIWAGQLVSMIGSGLIGFALSVWIFTETGKATPFAITALLSSLPRILLSPIAGVITDRWNRKKIMLISDSLSGLITLATAALLLTNEMQVWIVYLISFLGSVFASFQQPAYSASIVMMVSKKQLTRANSMIQMGQALESLLTPVLAGILVTTIGMRGIIIIDFIDMEKKSNQEKVFSALNEAFTKDRSKTHILPISEMGLIQMTRKRTRKPLTRLLCEPCPYCDGEGYIISIKTICYSIFREILRYAADMTGSKLTIRVNPEVADFLHGEENRLIPGLEKTLRKQIVIYPDSRYHMEAFEIIESSNSS